MKDKKEVGKYAQNVKLESHEKQMENGFKKAKKISETLEKDVKILRIPAERILYINYLIGYLESMNKFNDQNYFKYDFTVE